MNDANLIMATMKDDPPHPETLNIKMLRNSLEIIDKHTKQESNMQNQVSQILNAYH